MERTIGNFIFRELNIQGVFIVEPKRRNDTRGYFMETYKDSSFKEAGINCDFVQDNQSKSSKGVLRGLHFQIKYPQAKLVRVIEGEIFDVAVDLRRGSPTYGKWIGEVLSAEKGNMLMVPRGFAHGFIVLSDTAVFAYKCDNLYHPEDEGGIIWNDPEIGIVWPYDGKPLLSEKDMCHNPLKKTRIEFDL